MTIEQISLVIGIIIAVMTFIGGIVAGVFVLLQTVDRNTTAVDGLNTTVKAQWSKIDEHGTQLVEHGNKIVEIKTRLDYHETKVHNAKTN